MINSRQRHASIIAPRATVAFVTLFLFAVMFTAISGFSATIFWTGVGVNQVSGSSNNLAVGSNWTGGAVPGTTDDMAIILTNKTGPASLTNAVGNALSVQNLTITNTDSRSIATPNDSITFNGPVTLSSNFLLAATVDVSTYTLTATFSNSFSALNATLDGMLSFSKAGTLTLNFAGTTSIKSNLTFDATTEAPVAANKETTVLNILGVTTIGSNFTFLGGVGQNTINVNALTTVSNNFQITGNSGNAAAINQVIVNSNLTVLGTLSLSGGSAVASGPQNTLALNAPTVTVSNLIVSGSGATPYLVVAGGSTATVVTVRNNFITDSLDLNNGEIRIGGAFSNITLSANKAGFQADTGTFTFNGGGSIIQTAEVASVAGFGANNYVFGTFQVGDSLGETGFVRLVDSVVNNAGGTEQLVATNLSVFGGGTLDLNGLSASFRNGTNAGTILGLTTVGTGLAISNHLDNTGTIILGGGSIGGNGVITNAGSFLAVTGGGVVTNLLVNTASGILDTTNGTLVLVKNPVLLGTMNVRNGGTNKFGLAGDLVVTNSGTINLFGGALVQASLTNAGLIVSVSGGLISNSVINGASGFILATNGTLTVTSNIFNFGVITNSATLTASAGSVSNAATIVMSGGNLFAGAITNAGSISGFGTLSGTTVSSGLLTATNGELRLLGAVSGAGAYRAVAGVGPATLTFAGGGSISSLFNTNATIRLENVLTNTSVFVNQGTLTLAGGTYQSAANFTNAVGEVITNVGNGTLNAALVYNLGSIQAVAGTLTISNLFAQGGTVFIGPGGTLTTTGLGALTNFGTISLAGAAGNNAILNLGTAAITNLAGGTITGGGIVQDASQIVNLGNIFATSSAVELQFTNANTFGNAGTIGAGSGATLTFGGGSLSLGNAIVTNFGTISMTGGTLRSGTITNLSNGNLTGFGTISNLVVNLGTITAVNGTLVLATGPVQNAIVNVAGSGILSVTPAWTNNGTISIAAGGATTGGNLTNLASGTVTNFGTVNTLLVNQGRVVLGGTISNNYQQTSGTNTISGKGTITGIATVTGGLFDLNGGTYSNGLMILGGTGVLTDAVAGATFNGGLSNADVVGITADTFFNGPVTNTGAFFFQGAISNSFVNAVAGTVTLNNTVTITGNTLVNGGTFNLNGKTLTNGSLVVSGTGVFTNNGAGGTVNGSVSNAATIAVTADTFFNGALTNTGVMFYQGAISNTLVNSGSFNLNNNATLTAAPVNSGTINVASSKLTVIPDWANGGSLQINGGTLTGGAVTNLSGKGFSGFGTVSNLIVNNGTMTATGGTLTLVLAPVNNGTAIVANASALNVLPAWTNGGVLSNAATGAISGGTLTNTGTINGSGFINSLVVNRGRMVFGGTISNNFIQTSGTNTVSGSATIAQTASVNGGLFDLNGGTYSNGLMVLSGTGVLTNAITGATFNGGLSNAATVGVTANTFFNGPVTNTGTFAFLGAVSNTLVNSGDVILNGSGTISGVLANKGSVNVNSGVLALLVAPTQNGSITVVNGATLNAAQAWVNNGTVTLLGGVLTNATVTNAVFISGFGGIGGGGVVNLNNSFL
ncbi:MAG TPA: hypothetical protein VNL17_03820, partial [Verrucomicrobiae bacterium]|nr:hypothetical protein [Verrucomicrobiae bacterium]